MPGYVILYHQTPPENVRPSHWDFMLESHGTLRTWALDQLPQPGQTILGTALPDHRIDYLTYEGPISGNRGHVTQWDRGDYSWTEMGRVRLVLQLRGHRLQCPVTLTRDGDSEARWRFFFGGSAHLAATPQNS